MNSNIQSYEVSNLVNNKVKCGCLEVGSKMKLNLDEYFLFSKKFKLFV